MTKQRTLSEALAAVREELLAELRVSMPGEIVQYDHTQQLAQVKPLLSRRYRDGEVQELPLVNDVPVVWPRSGGAAITLPVNPGDSCLLVFADRSLDRWLSTGGTVAPGDGRKHHLSDAVAIMGLVPFAFEGAAPDNTHLRVTYAGSTISIAQDGSVDVESGNVATVKAPSIVLDGDVSVTGSVTATGDVTGDGISLASHTHGGVQSGSSNTGAPQ